MNDIITIGNKLELIQKRYQKQDEINNNVYISQILDFSDTTIQAAMPIFEGRLIPLDVGTLYETFLKNENGLYKTTCEVVGRSKVDNIYMVELKPLSKFESFQRRQYFRLNTNQDANIYKITNQELKDFEETNKLPDGFNDRKSAVIIDISGGGAKLVANFNMEKNDLILVEFSLYFNASSKELLIPARIISSTLSENRSDLYEFRIEYIKISKEIRESIIKFIFDQQRKIRLKERGW